jgi:hypothetical protein
LYRIHLKIRIFVRDQGDAEDQPAGILKYVEDLRRGPNADIGRKDFFEMGSEIIGQAPFRDAEKQSGLEIFAPSLISMTFRGTHAMARQHNIWKVSDSVISRLK